LYLAGFLAGWWLERVGPRLRPFAAIASPPTLRATGWIVAALGFALGAWGIAAFRAARTSLLPIRPAARIVTAGPYRFTRNPMYTGLAVAYIGAAIALDMGWPIVLLPLVLLALHAFVIRREERYLDGAFPDEYAAYRGRVRRW